MINMSLARIMYGTNEDVHVSSSINPSAFSARSSQSTRQDSVKSGPSGGFGRLSGILRKACTALTGN